MKGQSVTYTESDINLVGRNKTFHRFPVEQREEGKMEEAVETVVSGSDHKYASTESEVSEEQWKLK